MIVLGCFWADMVLNLKKKNSDVNIDGCTD